MNRLQRRNQRVLKAAIEKPDLIFSIEVNRSLLLRVHSVTWEDYWGCNAFAATKLESLRLSWDAFIASGYAEILRQPFVQAYFDLLHACLVALREGSVDLEFIKKIIGFETFTISGEQMERAAGAFNIRNPAYLLSRVAQPMTPDNPKFLPLIFPHDNTTENQPFFHYRRIGVSGKYSSQLFVYLSTNLGNRPRSFWLVTELFAALTSKTDPWVQKRTRLLFDGGFSYLVATLGLNRIRVADIGCGSAKVTMNLCRKAAQKHGTIFDLTLVDVVRTATSISRNFFRHLRAFGNVIFHHEGMAEWITKVAAENGNCFDLVLMLRVCDVLNRFTIEILPQRTASAMLHRVDDKSPLNVDVANPAKLLADGRMQSIHHRLARLRHRGSAVFQQFSLSDYFQGIKTIMDGKACCCEEGMIFTVWRYFDESSLVLPQGSSLIGELAKLSGTILIEDSDLTVDRIEKHIKIFGLTDLRVTDLSGYRERRGASVAFITKSPKLIKSLAS